MRAVSPVVLVLLSQGLALWASPPPLPQWARGKPQRFVLSGQVTTLDIASCYGSVTVEPGPDRSLRVELIRLTRAGLDQAGTERAAQVRLRPELQAGTLALSTTGPEGEKGWTDLVDYDVRILTPASWRAGGRGNAAPLVRVKSRDGVVRLRHLQGRQEVHASNGAVELEDLRGAAAIGTVEAPITGTGLQWDRAAVRSSGGNITLSLDALPAQADLQLSSAIGDLKLTLPPRANCQIEADTTAGQVVTEIAELKPGLRYNGRSLRGALGRGEARVKLQSTSGRIEVRQPTSPAN